MDDQGTFAVAGGGISTEADANNKIENETTMNDDEVEDDEEDDQEPGLSHFEAMTMVKAGLEELMKNDPLLSDLPGEITLEEVQSQIALEYGQAMAVNVRRADGEVMPVVVVQGASVRQLKDAIKRHIMLRQERRCGTKHVSWPYVWRTYWLYFDGQKLTDDNKQLKEYGIRNRNEVTFIKRLNKN